MAHRAVFYVHSIDEVLETIKSDYTVYETHGIKKSVVTKDAIYKSVEGFGSPDIAYECLYLWRSQGWTGSPSSPVSFFRKVHRVETNVKASTNQALSPYFHGGWITNTATGFHHGTVYLYDIVSAYRWAGTLGLPRRQKFFTGQPESEKFIAVVDVLERSETMPNFLQKDTTVITDEDLQTYDIKVKFRYGFECYDFDYFPESDFKKIEYLPEKAFKLATQSYWGIWAMREGVKASRVTVEGELKEWNIYNRNKKLVWALYIAHRVTEKVFNSYSNKVLNIYVDSILTKDQIIEGENIGDWKLKDVFYEGVHIRNAGLWTTIDSYLKNRNNLGSWYKHSGYS